MACQGEGNSEGAVGMSFTLGNVPQNVTCLLQDVSRTGKNEMSSINYVLQEVYIGDFSFCPVCILELYYCYLCSLFVVLGIHFSLFYLYVLYSILAEFSFKKRIIILTANSDDQG